jgi:hypothetical protein
MKVQWVNKDGVQQIAAPLSVVFFDHSMYAVVVEQNKPRLMEILPSQVKNLYYGVQSK